MINQSSKDWTSQYNDVVGVVAVVCYCNCSRIGQHHNSQNLSLSVTAVTGRKTAVVLRAAGANESPRKKTNQRCLDL